MLLQVLRSCVLGSHTHARCHLSPHYLAASSHIQRVCYAHVETWYAVVCVGGVPPQEYTIVQAVKMCEDLSTPAAPFELCNSACANLGRGYDAYKIADSSGAQACGGLLPQLPPSVPYQGETQTLTLSLLPDPPPHSHPPRLPVYRTTLFPDAPETPRDTSEAPQRPLRDTPETLPGRGWPSATSRLSLGRSRLSLGCIS